ncbi:MAG TPA: hypothetical protein VGL09_05450 [Methylomirabilota bacterium]|jgi:hypothetical protein
MTVSRSLFWSLGLVTTLTACSGGPSGPELTVAPKPAAPGQPVAAVVTPPPAMPEGSRVGYDRKGRRDPFEVLEVRQGAKGVTVSSAKLTGIVRGDGSPLALVETPEGLGYILKTGDTLGDGRLLEIGQDTVVFGVVPTPGEAANRVILKLATN